MFAASTEASGLKVVPGVVEDPSVGEVLGGVLDPVPWVGVEPGDDSDVDPVGGTLEDDCGELPIDVSDGCGELVGPDGDMLDDIDDCGELPIDGSEGCGELVGPGGMLDETDA